MPKHLKTKFNFNNKYLYLTLAVVLLISTLAAFKVTDAHKSSSSTIATQGINPLGIDKVRDQTNMATTAAAISYLPHGITYTNGTTTQFFTGTWSYPNVYHKDLSCSPLIDCTTTTMYIPSGQQTMVRLYGDVYTFSVQGILYSGGTTNFTIWWCSDINCSSYGLIIDQVNFRDTGTPGARNVTVNIPSGMRYIALKPYHTSDGDFYMTKVTANYKNPPPVPTNTPIPPTATPVPTNTPVPPTATPAFIPTPTLSPYVNTCKNFFGDKSDTIGGSGTTVISSNTSIPNIKNGDYIVKQYDNLTINSGVTLTTANPAKGLFIYVCNDANIYGNISMTGKGAYTYPYDISPDGLTLPMINTTSSSTSAPDIVDYPDFTGAGIYINEVLQNQPGISVSYPGFVNSIAARGQTGTGGYGGSVTCTNPKTCYTQYSTYCGTGGAGTAFSGGAGGGGGFGTKGGDGSAYGGSGGAGNSINKSYPARGGTGNPNGSTSTTGLAYGVSGNGGIVWLIVGGDLNLSGSITANGMPGIPGASVGAGGSGGGAIRLVYAGANNTTGWTTVSGGAGSSGSWSSGTAGGHGTSIAKWVDEGICVVDYAPKGNHDSLTCGVTSGWACDQSEYNVPIYVTLYRNDPSDPTNSDKKIYLARILANVYRRDVANAGVCGGTGNHGFTYNVPQNLYTQYVNKTFTIYVVPQNIGYSCQENTDYLTPKSIEANNCLIADCNKINMSTALHVGESDNFRDNVRGRITNTNLMPLTLRTTTFSWQNPHSEGIDWFEFNQNRYYTGDSYNSPTTVTNSNVSIPSNGDYLWDAEFTGSEFPIWGNYSVDLTFEAPNGGQCIVTGNVTQAPPAPTTTISIDNVNTCSASWTGSGNLDLNNPNNTIADVLQNVPNETNNPVEIFTTYTDDKGLEGMQNIYTWLDADGSFVADANPNNTYNNTIWGSNLKIGARFRPGVSSIEAEVYDATNNSWSWPTISFLIESGEAICTWEDANSIREKCIINNDGTVDMSSVDRLIRGYYKPISVVKSGNIYSIRWKVGILNATMHDKTGLKFYSAVVDNMGLHPDNPSETAVWLVDLEAPNPGTVEVDPPIINASDISYKITYNPSDLNSGLSSAIPRATTSDLSAAETFTIQDNHSMSHSFTTSSTTADPFLMDYYATNGITPFSENYKILNNNASNAKLDIVLEAKDRACNISTSVATITISAAPWLMTLNGDVYSDQFDMEIGPDTVTNATAPIFTSNVIDAKASTYLHLRNNAQVGVSTIKESLHDYNYSEYNDDNYQPRPNNTPTSWFSYIKTILIRSHNTNVQYHPQITSATTISIPMTDYFNANTWDLNHIHVIDIDNTLIMTNGATCKGTTRTIFIANDLVIEPNLLSDKDSGCIFIISGTTTITAGDDSHSTDTETGYDVIEAFIITNKVIVEPDALQDGLLIKGGLILDANQLDSTVYTDANGNIFGRELRIISNSSSPSEVILYDGTKYMYLFEDALYHPSRYNIRERHFILSKDI